ncbi:MAG: DNA-deoxyinosine glycosylase [Lachnospiraceae bacterium]|nr:DNA-deoxyinosine glycosylase [Lachnospiraceae bacterium]
MQDYQHLHHEFPPVYDSNSKILILGSFPSVKSREQQFYYGHPQNRFWKVLAAVTADSVPRTIAEKKDFLLRHKIALWDVIEECEIIGSSDSSIRNVVPVDIAVILRQAPIQKIFANGTKAYELYQKYLLPVTGLVCEKLPSTSPANAAYSLDRLTECWRETLNGVLDK